MSFKVETTTPHLRIARDSGFARVLVCGAPERAEKIASMLEGSRVVAKNREYHSFAGRFGGKEILVTSHGVGAAGAVICFKELADVGAKAIIRVGTAGGLYPDSRIGDVVVATGGVRDEGTSTRMVPVEFPAVPDLALTQALLASVSRRLPRARPGVVVSTDTFYPGLLESRLPLYGKAGALAVEMEASALFVTGMLHGVRTAAVVALDGDTNVSASSTTYDPTANDLQTALLKAAEAALETLSQS